MSDDVDLLRIDCGSVIAPAGCGKTELIVSAVAGYTGSKPILVLTHTNAGVAALRERFQNNSIPNKKFVLSTLDGWCIKLGQSFPARSGLLPKTLSVGNPTVDYSEIREAVASMLEGNHFDEIIKANFAHVLVDEYQDCNTVQHKIVGLLAALLPTCVLGDPLQAIFGFDSPIAWDVIQKTFPIKGNLTIPWRWKNAGNEALGKWILNDLRAALTTGQSINLASGPEGFEYVQLSDQFGVNVKAKVTKYFELLRRGTVLVIGDSKIASGRHDFARSVRRCGVVEPVDMKEFIKLGKDLDANNVKWDVLCAAFGDCVTGINLRETTKRINTIRADRVRKPSTKFELAALTASDSGSPSSLLAVHEVLAATGKPYRVFRQHFFASLKRMLQLKIQEPTLSYLQCATKVREHARFLPRLVDRGCIGSTLLLKGLQADSVLILDAENISAGNAGERNLYVALTRGCKRVVVFAKSAVLTPNGR